MTRPIFSQRKSRRPKVIASLIIVTLIAIAVYYFFFLDDDSSLKVKTSSQSTQQTEPAIEDQPELKVETVLEGLDHPWEIAFIDDVMLFTERSGDFFAYVDDTKQLVETIDNVEADGEGGLLGLAIDSNFENNQYIYMCYNYKKGNKRDVRVSRFEFDVDQLSLGGPTDIVTGIPAKSTGRHSGCRLAFDDDNHLWITTGDAANEKNPQGEDSLGGKVLRVTRNGDGATGNRSDPFDDRIFNYGHRNVQGIALLEEPSGAIFGVTTEHGPDVDDEVNPLRTGNFGWDPGKGYDEDVPMTDLEKFSDAIEAIWSSGDDTIAISGATYVRGTQWQGFDGWLAIAVLKGEKVLMLNIDENFKVQDEVDVLSEYGRIRTVVQSPDGDLYIATDNGDDKILRVTPRS
jgi:glucose/arabinose dehydrogenase